MFKIAFSYTANQTYIKIYNRKGHVFHFLPKEVANGIQSLFLHSLIFNGTGGLFIVLTMQKFSKMKAFKEYETI